MKVLVIPISEKQWDSLDLASAVEDAIDAGRRIRKKIDVKRQRKRFSVACSRIEEIAVQNLRNERIELEGDAADNFVEALRDDDGITYPFVPSADLPKFLKRLRGGALASLKKIQGGIIILLLPYEKLSYSHRVIKAVPTPAKPSSEPQISLPELDTKRKYLSDWQLVEMAHHQIQEALISNHPLNASYIPHEVFTEVIRCYLYCKNESISFWQRFMRRLTFLLGQWHPPPPVMLRIAYSDGSEGKPFPMLYLSKKLRPAGLPIMKAGLMSMRHSESLDPLVDVYLLRNKDIDSRDTFAEQDSIAYDKALGFLSDVLSLKERVELHLYHTGLEPAVVGTYRAVVEMLHKYRGQLVVVPVFIREDGYQEAEAWF
ncbi:MAG: hypothetical protein N2V75_04630 [Methanophagales archaeon]|nr:hypothetical protein [Methanophagales archaeon]